jgi:hypothetical protein
LRAKIATEHHLSHSDPESSGRLCIQVFAWEFPMQIGLVGMLTSLVAFCLAIVVVLPLVDALIVVGSTSLIVLGLLKGLASFKIILFKRSLSKEYTKLTKCMGVMDLCGTLQGFYSIYSCG